MARWLRENLYQYWGRGLSNYGVRGGHAVSIELLCLWSVRCSFCLPAERKLKEGSELRLILVFEGGCFVLGQPWDGENIVFLFSDTVRTSLIFTTCCESKPRSDWCSRSLCGLCKVTTVPIPVRIAPTAQSSPMDTLWRFYGANQSQHWPRPHCVHGKLSRW